MAAMLRFLLGLAFAVLCFATPSAETEEVCKYLFRKYPKQLVYYPLGPHGVETLDNVTLYRKTTFTYWNVKSAENKAACQFFPSKAEQVSDAVKQLNAHPSVKFALKSGGHNANLGYSSVDQGLLISFRPNMQSTVMSADRKTADVGPGGRWGEIYEETLKYNRVVVGGRLGHIGAGGYNLGGGLSYLSSQYGFACDNVVKFEVVLANGTITQASANKNPDLYWALKGGGNRFAIVTTYTLKTHPMGMVWGGTRIYAKKQHKDILSAVSNFIRTYPDPKAAIIPTFSFGGPAEALTSALVFFFYDGPSPPAGVFDEFDKIKSLQDSTRTKTYTKLTNSDFGGYLPGMRYAIRASTYPNLPHDKMLQFLDKQYELTASKAVNDSSKDIDFQLLTMALQPMSKRIVEASEATGGNTLGLDPKSGDHVWVSENLSWLNPVCDDACPAYLAQVGKRTEEYQRAHYKGIKPTHYESGDVAFTAYNPRFMNDAEAGEDVYASYGSANHARLRSIQKSVDPSGFLTARQGGFIL